MIHKSSKEELIRVVEELKEGNEGLNRVMLRGLKDAKEEYLIDPELPFKKRYSNGGIPAKSSKQELMDQVAALDLDDEILVSAVLLAMYDEHAGYINDIGQDIDL